MTDLPPLPDAVHSIYGFLSAAEAEMLYRLAAAVPAGGTIVEIGSFQGKSTVCLGLGAKHAGARVYAIDPHEDYQESETTHYGMENHAALLKNLVEFGVADVVRVVAFWAISMRQCWLFHEPGAIELLWIDGLHDYESVVDDLSWFNCMMRGGKIVLHDTSGFFPDVNRAINTLLSNPYYGHEWRVAETIDAMTVLERV